MRSPKASPKARLAIATLAAAALLAPVGQGWLPPPPEFSDVTDGSGIDFPVHQWDPSLGPATSLLDVLPAGSPAVADFNLDAFMDVFFPSPRYTDDALNALRQPRSALYFNDGSQYTTDGERFLDVTDVAGIGVTGHAYAASWGDLDGDGYPDLFVGGYRLAKLFRNHQDGTFRDVSAAAGLSPAGFVLGGAWGDYDRDGHLDLALAQFADYTHPGDGLPDLRDLPGLPNVLLRNRGDGTFEDASAAAGLGAVARRSTSASFVDVDGDGWPELYVTNYGQPAELWHNNRDGTFTERASGFGLADGAGATCQVWEDLDRDGLLDLFVAHEAGVRDGAWRNTGAGAFAPFDAAGLDATAPGDGWGCLAFDFDFDGDHDLVVANAGLDGAAQPVHFLLNRLQDTGALAFEPSIAEAGDNDQCYYTTVPTLATPRALSGLAAFDFDLHGTPDLVGTAGFGDAAHLYKNTGWVGLPCGSAWAGGNGNYVRAFLHGDASNAPGLGAVLTVSAGHITVTRQAGAGATWGGQSLLEAQFGIAKPEEAGYLDIPLPVNLTVRWPSGTVESYVNQFAANSLLRLYEGQGYKLDPAPPRPTLAALGGTLTGQNGWYKSATVMLKLTAADASVFESASPKGFVTSLRYSRDGTTWVNVPSAKSGVTLTFSGEGVHKLWVEASDDAVLVTPTGMVSAPNKAVYLYPIRIDTTPPTAAPGEPDPVGVYAQGRELAQADAGTPEDRAIVVAPLALGFAKLGGEGAALEALVGSDGLQRVRAQAADARSGVWKVDFELLRANGAVVASGTARLAPYTWAWDPHDVAAGEYRLRATVRDFAGLAAGYAVKVVVLPTSPDGADATVAQGPSLPTTG